MTHEALSIFNQLRPVTVGFDSVFDHFERMFEHNARATTVPNYPPYNIVKTGQYTYDIELALAGYSKKDITVTFEESVLTIKSVKTKQDQEFEDNVGMFEDDSKPNEEMLHQGIAKRQFTKTFTIADEVEIKGAQLKDGLLKVTLERIIPEHKKAKNIVIK
jgi:molecular chaperone IbpA